MKKRTPIEKLRRLARHADGTVKRGAISRLAEALGIHPQVAKRYLNGDWTPGRTRQEEIGVLLADGLDLSPKKRGSTKRVKSVV